MPTNCRGQDKPGQGRGYQWPRTRTGEREVPQAGEGVGQGGGLRCCLHPALPDPACPQAGSTGQQPKLGAPAAHRSSASPRFSPAVCAWG